MDVQQLKGDKDSSPSNAARLDIGKMHTAAESESMRDATMQLAGWEIAAWWEWGSGAAGGD